MGALLQPIKVCYGSEMTHTGVLVLKFKAKALHNIIQKTGSGPTYNLLRLCKAAKAGPKPRPQATCAENLVEVWTRDL